MSEEKKHYQRPLNFKTGKVEMNFGAGGKASAQLIADLFAKNFSNEFLDQGDDGARLPQPKGELVMATDSHVVSPIFFAGGDIGGLSIHGTVNDVAVCGATPLYISCGFILEEGFPLSDLKRIVESMAAAAKEAGVKIVTGDTKVVERGKAEIPSLRCMRDPTRGGLGTTLNEIAKQSSVGMVLEEDKIPVKESVEAACEFLGLDPLYVANEGKVIAICAPEEAEKMLQIMRDDPLGKNAQIIGRCIEDENHFVQMETGFGGVRMVDWLTGEQLPRIC